MKTLKKCNVTVMVKDMDIAIAFYTQKLGLSLKARYENHYAEIDAGGLSLGLHPADDQVQYGNSLSVGFGVDDFEGATSELENNGIKLSIQRDGWSKLAHFTDPDNNPLYVIEVK